MIGTFIAGLFVIALISAAVFVIVRDRRNGAGCCGSCKGCRKVDDECKRKCR